MNSFLLGIALGIAIGQIIILIILLVGIWLKWWDRLFDWLENKGTSKNKLPKRGTNEYIKLMSELDDYTHGRGGYSKRFGK